jgi:hypothetical protein
VDRSVRLTDVWRATRRSTQRTGPASVARGPRGPAGKVETVGYEGPAARRPHSYSWPRRRLLDLLVGHLTHLSSFRPKKPMVGFRSTPAFDKGQNYWVMEGSDSFTSHTPAAHLAGATRRGAGEGRMGASKAPARGSLGRGGGRGQIRLCRDPTSFDACSTPPRATTVGRRVAIPATSSLAPGESGGVRFTWSARTAFPIVLCG